MVLPKTFNTFGTFHTEKLPLCTTRIESKSVQGGRKGSSDPFLQSTKVKDFGRAFEMVRVVPSVWVIGADGERGTDSVDNDIDFRWEGPLAKTAKR